MDTTMTETTATEPVSQPPTTPAPPKPKVYLSQEEYTELISKTSVPTFRDPKEYVRVNVKSPLYADLLCDYYDRIGITPKWFHPSIETPAEKHVRDTDDTKTRTYLYVEENPATREIEVEIHLSTIGRAFGIMGIRTKKQLEVDRETAANGGSSFIDPTDSTEDNSATSLNLRAVGRFTDTFLVYRDSHAIQCALKKEREKAPHLQLDPMAIQSKLYMDGDNAISRVEDCVIVQQHRVWVQENFERTNGFPGGFTPLGICGKGVGFGIGSPSKEERRKFLFIINLMGPELPTARLTKDKNQEPSEADVPMNDVIDQDDPLGLKKKKIYLTLDTSTVYPVWYACSVETPAEVVCAAVSSQRSITDHAFAACVGRAKVSDDASIKSPCSVYVYAAALDVTGKANRTKISTLVDHNPPINPAVPNFIVLSSKLVVLAMIDATGGGEKFPPHMYIRRYERSADNGLAWVGEWEPFLIELPPVSADDPPPKFYVERVAAGELQVITSGAFDDYDPCELILGTYDGLLLPYHIHSSEDGGVLQCTRRNQTPFITPSYEASIKQVNEAIARTKGKLSAEQQRALIDSVGVMRSPILSIHSSFGTHGGRINGDTWWAEPCVRELWEERAAFKITCGHATGVAWQIGDKDTVSMVQLKRLACNGVQTGSALRCTYTYGRVLAINDLDSNYVHLIHLTNGTPIGSIGLETKKSSAIKGEAKQVFQSLWMDVGRITLLYPDGDIAIVVPASAESIAERERTKKAQETAMREKRAKQIKELEETAAKMHAMSINQGEDDEQKKQQQQPQQPENTTMTVEPPPHTTTDTPKEAPMEDITGAQ